MAGTYEKIATTTLSSTASTVTFSSISGAYTDLVLSSDNVGDALNALYIRFNLTTGTTNYSETMISADGSNGYSYRGTNGGFSLCGVTDTTRSSFVVNIMNYSNTTTYKSFLSHSNTTSFAIRQIVGLWRVTSAITSVEIVNPSGLFSATSMFTLYGIKAA